MTVLALTLPLARRSAIHVPRRDLVVGAGDALRLRVALVEADRPELAPLDLSRLFARVRMHVFRDASPLGGNDDYGPGWRSAPVATSASAMATGDDPRAVEIRLEASETRGWLGGGRLGWSLQAALGGGNAFALCWGALHMRPGLGMPPLHVLDSDGARVVADDGRWVVV